jgi:hypothetical protein
LHFPELLAFLGWYVASFQFVKYVFTLMAMLVFEIPVIVLFTSNVTKVSLFRITKKEKKSKAVPLHAMESHGGRGGIAHIHS